MHKLHKNKACVTASAEEAEKPNKKSSRKVFGGAQKVWDIAFELSAPQILVPEHFIDKDALIMVLDFGKLHVKNDGHDMIVRQQQEQVKKCPLNLFQHFNLSQIGSPPSRGHKPEVIRLFMLSSESTSFDRSSQQDHVVRNFVINR